MERKDEKNNMKMLRWAFALVCVLMVIALFGGKMRKDFPFDIEVVPGDKSVMVVNTNPWTQRDCTVELRGPDIHKDEKIILPASTKSVVIEELSNKQQYRLTVKRSDFLGQLRFRPLELAVVPQEYEKYIVFIGASIGRAWNLRNFSERNNIKMFVGYRGTYEFDKTSLVEAVCNIKRKPDMVIIKECAAYFPQDSKRALVDVDQWVKRLVKAAIQPVLATVVPITSDLARATPGRMQSINDFNEGLRAYGRKNNIDILDMQGILADKRTTDGFLDQRYADSDGLHLNPDAYKKLDYYLLKIVAGDQ